MKTIDRIMEIAVLVIALGIGVLFIVPGMFVMGIVGIFYIARALLVDWLFDSRRL